MEWSWLKSCIFIKQHRWPLRGIKWNHLSTPRNALQDAGGAAALCVTEVTGWGARGAAVDVHKFCCPRFPERKQSQEKNVPEEQRLALLHHHRASLTATAANSPAETMEALSGAGQRCPLVTVCWHPGTRSQLPPHSWITASSLLRACAPRCCFCLLKENIALSTSVSFFSARGLGWFLAEEKKSQRTHVFSIL